MRASQYGRFRVRLRKIAWLLPIAMAAGMILSLSVGLPGAALKYVPGLSPARVSLAMNLSSDAWVVITIFCSVQVVRRIAKVRRASRPLQGGAATFLAMAVFFGYLLAAGLIVVFAGYIHAWFTN